MITHAVSTGLILAICIVGMFVPVDISYHGGAMVVFADIPMFQLNGVLMGGVDEHEYNHYLQQADMGDRAYYAGVVVPSLITNVVLFIDYKVQGRGRMSRDWYYGLPWESFNQ